MAAPWDEDNEEDGPEQNEVACGGWRVFAMGVGVMRVVSLRESLCARARALAQEDPREAAHDNVIMLIDARANMFEVNDEDQVWNPRAHGGLAWRRGGMRVSSRHCPARRSTSRTRSRRHSMCSRLGS